MSKRRPIYDGVIDGVRIRCYPANRTEFDVVFGDREYDPDGEGVWVYPRSLGPNGAAACARKEYDPKRGD